MKLFKQWIMSQNFNLTIWPKNDLALLITNWTFKTKKNIVILMLTCALIGLFGKLPSVMVAFTLKMI